MLLRKHKLLVNCVFKMILLQGSISEWLYKIALKKHPLH